MDVGEGPFDMFKALWLHLLWQPGSLYEIRANWGWYWAGCGMVKIIIKQGGAERINQKYI